MRTLSPRRQPRRIFPRSVYRIAFESRLRSMLLQHPLVTVDQDSRAHQTPSHAFLLDEAHKIARDRIKYIVKHKVAFDGGRLPDSSALMSSRLDNMLDI